MTKTLGICASFLLVAMLSACGNNNNGNNNAASPSPVATNAPTGTTSVQASNAEALYKANCISCHGTDLEGKMGGNTNLQHVGADLDTDQIVNQITNGGGGMMAFKGRLSEDEIKALADWLAAKK